jgi:hypothetical protein
MILRNHNVYGRVRHLRAMTLAGDAAAEVNRQEARLVERGHHGCGQPGIIPRTLRPERTLVASDRKARIDV